MTDPRAELAALVAEARALVQAAMAVGHTHDVAEPSTSTPASDAPAEREGLVQVRADLGDCRRCGLCQGRTNLVFGAGDPRAELMVIGEAPGEREDAIGEPFVGAAGEVLEKMLVNVLGLARDQVYIANVVKCRPPGNRNPLPDEIARCLPFLHRQIRAIRPRLILVLGGVAYKSLFTTAEGITRARGRWHELDGVPVMPTFHPDYLLRNPEGKRPTFEDLKQVRARLDALRAAAASGVGAQQAGS